MVLHVHLTVSAGFQDNEPLMRALSKLINLNNPDLVLFVGEALVGNDAVDQLSKFNQVWFYIVSVLPHCLFFFPTSWLLKICFTAEISGPLNISHTQINRWDLAHKI